MTETRLAKMAATRAAKNQDNPMSLDGLISVEGLESMVRWHIGRDPQAIVSATSDHRWMTVRLGSPKAKRCIFAIRIKPRHWEVRFGDRTGYNRKHDDKQHSMPGYSLQEFVTADGKRVDTFGFNESIHKAKELSALAVNYCSPFEMGTQSDGRLRLKKMDADAALDGNTTIDLRGGEPDDAGTTTTDTVWVVDRDRKRLVRTISQFSSDNQLLRQSVPCRDWQSLGVSTDVEGFIQACNQYWQLDQAANHSAMCLAAKLQTMCQQVTGMQMEFIWPGYVFAGKWKKVFIDSMYTACAENSHTLRCGFPTLHLLKSLRVVNRGVPPCIVVTLPVYTERQARFSNAELNSCENETEKPHKVKQILLMPVPSADMDTGINPDITSQNVYQHRTLATLECNFGKNCDYKRRGATYLLDHATGLNSAVAFCMNSPDTELVHAYWGTDAERVNKYESHLQENKNYGLLATNDALVTRIGALVAEQFFNNVS